MDITDAGALLGVPGASEGAVIARLLVGGEERDFTMFGEVRSTQIDRVQIDAAADGSMHVVSCKGSVGSCEVTLLDREFTCGQGSRSSSDFALKCYTNEVRNYRNRKATLELYSESNKLIARFVGIITGVRVSVSYREHTLLPLTTLFLSGSWDD